MSATFSCTQLQSSQYRKVQPKYNACVLTFSLYKRFLFYQQFILCIIKYILKKVQSQKALGEDGPSEKVFPRKSFYLDWINLKLCHLPSQPEHAVLQLLVICFDLKHLIAESFFLCSCQGLLVSYTVYRVTRTFFPHNTIAFRLSKHSYNY